MKHLKLFLAFALFASASPAFATTTVIHITGSTTCRYATNLAILSSFGPLAIMSVGCTSSSLRSSDVSYFKGDLLNGDYVIIETNFIGSAGGIKAITSAANLDFLPDNLDQTSGATITMTAAAMLSSNPTFSSGNGLNGIPSGVNQANVEVTISDIDQASTIYRTPVLTQPAQGYLLGPGPVGVVPYVWIRTPSSDTAVNAIDGMNRLTAILLYGNGNLPLAFWSGSASDETSWVYAAGRNPNSGTRLNAFAESGLGANASVAQYHPASGGTTSTAVSGISLSGSITSIEVFPDTTVSALGQTFLGGNGGEASGFALLSYMSKAFNIGTPGALIAYCGLDDASTAVKQGAVPLAWEGVSIMSSNGLGNAPTVDLDQVRNGTYTFWGYEHVYYYSGLPSTKKTIVDNIANAIRLSLAPVTLSSMRVRRSIDGGVVGPNY